MLTSDLLSQDVALEDMLHSGPTHQSQNQPDLWRQRSPIPNTGSLPTHSTDPGSGLILG